MSAKVLLLLVGVFMGCTPQMAALGPSMASQAANFLFQQERMDQQAQLQREQEHEREQQLYLQQIRSQP